MRENLMQGGGEKKGGKGLNGLRAIRNTLQANGRQRQCLTNFLSNYLVINAPALGDSFWCGRGSLHLMKLPVLLPKQWRADLCLLRLLLKRDRWRRESATL